MKPAIKPVGVGDLTVVKQRIARYEPGEIAHIENVMATESRSREHRKLTQREEIFSSETERQIENTKDLQSAERFELQQESQKTIKSESKFEAGANVSGSYGTITFGAYGKYAQGNSTEESEKNASNYAKEITEKTVNKIIERVREERKTRLLEEIEETNKHGFENSGGKQNFAGVYRWVDKYYRAKRVNYGKRLMYEFLIPEPAVFYIYAQKVGIEKSILPVEPNKPKVPDSQEDLIPNKIDRINYLTLVKEYMVEGVNPPPPEEIILENTISRTLQNDAVWSISDEELEIPDGYEFTDLSYDAIWTHKESNKEDFDGVILMGLDVHKDVHEDEENEEGEENEEDEGFQMSETGRLSKKFPIGGTGFGHSSVLIGVQIVCTLTTETFEKWQLSTYSAIMNAYNKQLMDYEERLAAARVQGGVQINGRNPLINREIEREALRKGCIRIWAKEPFSNPEGILHDTENYPEINTAIDDKEFLTFTEKIQFFEQAFDWANLTYEFYPYYWGRKGFWLDKYIMEDDDPFFESFLRAGYARVIVPVNLSHNKAVLWYQLTGEIWQGGEIPALIGDNDEEIDLYNSYLDDLGEAEGIDDIYKDIEILPDDPDSWLIKVPTSLVWLQGDSTLPDFEAGMTDNSETPSGDGQGSQSKNWCEAIKKFFQWLRIWVLKLFGFKAKTQNHV